MNLNCVYLSQATPIATHYAGSAPSAPELDAAQTQTPHLNFGHDFLFDDAGSATTDSDEETVFDDEDF